MPQDPLVLSVGQLLRNTANPHLEEQIKVADHAWLPEVELRGQLTLRADVDRVGEALMVMLSQVKGRATDTCARCLTAYERSFSLPRATRLFPFDASGSGEEDVTPGLDVANQTLDLRPFLREELLLGLDVTPRCTPDCKGLCPSCGVNRNTTPCACPDPIATPPATPLAELSTLWAERQGTDPDTPRTSS